MHDNSTGSNNTAVGQKALYTNQVKSNHTAIGQNALFSNTNGIENTAVGGNALYGNTTAQYNTAVGRNCMTNTTTGGQNTAIGRGSMFPNETGSGNAAIGYGALGGSTASSNNVAIGHSALSHSSLSGSFNTCVGWRAGNAITSGGKNIVIGQDADPSSATVSNEITLGNSDITALRCQVTSITALSDKRDKTDIVDLPVGLEFINSLLPRKFKWQTREGTIKDGSVRAGFIAQELQEAQKGSEFLDLVYDSNPDKLEASYGNLIPVLVKAIQELSAEVAALKAA